VNQTFGCPKWRCTCNLHSSRPKHVLILLSIFRPLLLVKNCNEEQVENEQVVDQKEEEEEETDLAVARGAEGSRMKERSTRNSISEYNFHSCSFRRRKGWRHPTEKTGRFCLARNVLLLQLLFSSSSFIFKKTPKFPWLNMGFPPQPDAIVRIFPRIEPEM
jgi:hypothetical protein